MQPWSLPEPTLTAPAASPDLPAGHAAEPKWDGYRALLGRWADGTVMIRSRRGTDMTAAFPEITAAAARLPADIGPDGELVVWEHQRLAFERLQGRLNRSAASAARVAAQWPAHFVAFDLLHLGEDLTRWSYVRRRAALEQLFADHALRAPWVLCPSMTDPGTAASWLAWASVGMEGLVFKSLHQPYVGRGRRAWRKYRQRASTEAIVGGVTGTVAVPSGVLLVRRPHHATPPPGRRGPGRSAHPFRRRTSLAREDVLRRLGQPRTPAGGVGRAAAGRRGRRRRLAGHRRPMAPPRPLPARQGRPRPDRRALLRRRQPARDRLRSVVCPLFVGPWTRRSPCAVRRGPPPGRRRPGAVEAALTPPGDRAIEPGAGTLAA